MAVDGQSPPASGRPGDAGLSADELVLDELYTLHGPGTYGFALGIVRDGPAAERITCAAFLETWRQLEGGEAPETTRSLLLCAVHRRAAAHVRESYPSPKRDAGPPGMLPRGFTLRRENAWGVLSLLSDVERDAVVLAFFGRNTLEEIAERLQLPLAAARAQLDGALTRLQGLGEAEA